MSRMQRSVAEFHVTFGSPWSQRPRLLDESDWKLRVNLITEELSEYVDACQEGDIVEIADALGDMLYVVFGTAVAHGIDMGPIFEEIHRSNMSKLGEDGEPIYRDDGKVLKGPNWTPPNLAPILEEQG